MCICIPARPPWGVGVQNLGCDWDGNEIEHLIVSMLSSDP